MELVKLIAEITIVVISGGMGVFILYSLAKQSKVV